ncbi:MULTISPECIES: MFS transporter [Rhizobium]|jgi:MFS family permease|uniref:Predicted arabinose efflux permease, MFS family n=1 Tax=Rhizobium lusitanum TaxID=293958 RepID=A0A1C3V9T2_9HYPH|nr:MULTISPECIES: MFS transporter [Rhizobium]NKJ35540.1 MFS family permease [Rhizobium sp. SG570]SCB24580.1 Predicted arabinose efflux permease, MFS family [Rhizobium lusitanum]
MTRLIPEVFRDPTIRVSMLAIFAFGFAGAATSPYQSVVGIRELGLSNGLYSALIFCAAAVNVIVSILLGNLADRIGEYRTMMLTVALFGILGYGAVYVVPTQATFILAALFLLPIYGSLNSLLFANVRVATNGMERNNVATVNSGVRAMISLSWVLVPGITGALLANSASMLPAYLFAGLACAVCFGLIAVFLPRQSGTDKAATRHLSYLAALGEVISPPVFVRVIAVALISSTLHVNGAILPLIVTGAAHGSVADIGVLVGIVALLEVIFIVVWGRAQRIMSHVTALALGTVIYVVYLLLLGLASAPWHVYALTLISGIGAAALISIPITYLQDLIAERPGLGSALISVNIFLSAGLSALLFALGTATSSYSGTAVIGAVAGVVGLAMLLFFDGARRRG